MPPRVKQAAPREKRQRTSCHSPSPSTTPCILLPLPTNDLRSFETRSITVEWAVTINVITPFKVHTLLSNIGWENILHCGGNAYPSLVRSVYASIKECSMDEANLFFKIGFSDQDFMFDVTRVSSILNVHPSNNGPKSVSDSLSAVEMVVITETLCGDVIPWEDVHLAQMRIPSPEIQRHQGSTSRNDPIQEEEHADEQPSQASLAPSFGDHLTNLERDMTAVRQDLGDMKKKQFAWMKKIFLYLSNILKSCQRDDVDAPASPSPPPDLE
ncbi:hypothetical protein MRB53_023663 [Persea americana]|uniref:Uncharacterized protein n=1 Tax=Persea americana TaxID=3435 RepID=A0ACC2LAH7_PERAE|nr:hypothetical protein MRB53_023663 [Persea americana]